MTKKAIKTVSARVLEGSSSNGGWFFVVTTFLNFMRDIIPPTFPESGFTFAGAVLCAIAGGATTATVHQTLKTSKKG